MIEQIYINNYRNFVNFLLDLNETTLLCGLNGTGKTSVIEIMAKLRDFIVGKSLITDEQFVVNYVCSSEDVTRWLIESYGSAITTFGFKFRHGENVYSYDLDIKSNFKDKICRVEAETLKLNDNVLYEYKVTRSDGGSRGDAKVITDDQKTIEFPHDWNFSGLSLASRFNSKIKKFVDIVGESIHAVSLNPFSMLHVSENKQPLLEMSGRNFSAWYRWVVDNHIRIVNEWFQDCEEFIPNFKQFSLKERGDVSELAADMMTPSDSEPWRLLFSELSHGQKILCVFYLLFRVVPNDSTIFIDEFENYLAPSELQPLYNLMTDETDERNIQFILVSHHQKTLNWYHDEAQIFSTFGIPSIVRNEKHFVDSDFTLLETIENGRRD